MQTDGAISRLRELDRDTVIRVLELLRQVHPYDIENAKRDGPLPMFFDDGWEEVLNEVERRVTGEEP